MPGRGPVGSRERGVPLRTRVLYASPALALAVVGIPVYVHLPKFYTDVVGVPVASLAIPSSLQADVIDYDELRTGERREGRYVGVWSVSRKAAAALGVGIGLPVLGLAGYEPNAEQSPTVILTLRVLYALVPVLCNLAAIALAARYPIDRERQGAILRAVERRRRGLRVRDPLEPSVVLGGPSRMVEAGAR